MLLSNQHGVNKVFEWSDNNAFEINTKFRSPSDSHKVPIVIHNERNQTGIFIQILGCNDRPTAILERPHWICLQKDKTKNLFSFCLLGRMHKFFFCFLLLWLWVLYSIVGQPLEKLYESAYHNNILRLANNVFNSEYKLLLSKWRSTLLYTSQS